MNIEHREDRNIDRNYWTDVTERWKTVQTAEHRGRDNDKKGGHNGREKYAGKTQEVEYR